MLVLSRKKDQTLIVGDAVLTVSRLDGNRVRIAIDAPKTVKVLRGEIAQANQWPLGHPMRKDANDVA